ncbi:MAG: hypothetical protein HQL21_08175, partial [Candidatus Omnitrophica bacterium]|nr:hypothetical protein [Candidatus Omnitrophota bacterium]
MIKINLVPELERKDKGGFLNGGVGGYPQEIIAGVLVAVFGLLLMIHAVFGGIAFWKIIERNILQARWNSLAADKKMVDEVSDRIRVIQMKMAAVRPIMAANSILWSGFLKDVS